MNIEVGDLFVFEKNNKDHDIEE
nr:hypothetical protein [Acinetobacter harbinensis]